MFERAVQKLASTLAEELALRHAVVSQATPEGPPNALGLSQISIDYPIWPRPRFGFGAPAHPQLESLLATGEQEYTALLDSFASYIPQLRRIPRTLDAAGVGEPGWLNEWLPGLDALAIYSFLASRAPRTYLEVGSGNSTKFARRAIRDHELPTSITSIDPAPRAEIDAICDRVLRSPLEDTDLSVFTSLAPGDVVFIDNSHRCFQNSDVTVFFLEVLPKLPSGVLVGIHDIFLPYDYPPEWVQRYYSEQYLLAAFLLGGHTNFRVALPAYYCSVVKPLKSNLDAFWSWPELADVPRHGGGFWLERL